MTTNNPCHLGGETTRTTRANCQVPSLTPPADYVSALRPSIVRAPPSKLIKNLVKYFESVLPDSYNVHVLFRGNPAAISLIRHSTPSRSASWPLSCDLRDACLHHRTDDRQHRPPVSRPQGLGSSQESHPRGTFNLPVSWLDDKSRTFRADS